MAVTFHDLSSAAGLKKLDDYLLSRSYISGYLASKDDLLVHGALSKSPSADYVNVARWYNHIEALLRISGVSGEGCGVSIEGSAPVAETIATPPAADTKATVAEDDSDDDVDLFGEETEEEKKASEARAAAAKASGKKKESGKSSVLMDIKPWDDETDMKKLEEAVRAVQMEGLLWGASKLMPVGYGIKKLQIMMTIVDDLVSVDTLIEERLTVEPINEYVQSCDIVAFNKICRATRAVVMMLRQSPRRNQRSKGMKVKHVLQVSLLLGLCMWLLFYQMPRLNDGESSSRQGIKSLQRLKANGIKLGRKDLKPKIETKEEIEDAKQNEGQAEENKPQEEKSDHGKTSVDGIKETKHQDKEEEEEEEGRQDKEKDDKSRNESSVEENGKHHKLERAESNAKNDTGKSKENKIEETTQGNKSNAKPSKENATKEEKKQLKSEGDDLTNNSSSTEKVSLSEKKKENVTKQKEYDENSKSNDTAASPVEARSSEQDSASYHNSSPRTAPVDDQNQDMELSPSSSTKKHDSVDSSTSIVAPTDAGANTK